MRAQQDIVDIDSDELVLPEHYGIGFGAELAACSQDGCVGNIVGGIVGRRSVDRCMEIIWVGPADHFTRQGEVTEDEAVDVVPYLPGETQETMTCGLAIDLHVWAFCAGGRVVSVVRPIWR